MESFVKFLYELLKQFFGGFWKAITGVFGGAFDLVNIPAYADLGEEYNSGVGVGGWNFIFLSRTRTWNSNFLIIHSSGAVGAPAVAAAGFGD